LKTHRKSYYFLLIVALAAVLVFVIIPTPKKVNSNFMKLSSPIFENGGDLPEAYTCLGQGNNPPLEISGVKGDAVTLALVVDDSDAPTGDFVHWVVWNISRETTRLDEGLVPPHSVEGQNSLGQTGFVAPCPPSGTHTYHFKLYALDKDIDLPETADKNDLIREMTGHIIDESEILAKVKAK
jgi:hypothetical protein